MARRGTVVAVVPTEPDAEDLADDLALFTKSFLIPAWETLPFEHISPNLQTMARRAEGLRMLKEAPPDLVVVASARAAT